MRDFVAEINPKGKLLSICVNFATLQFSPARYRKLYANLNYAFCSSAAVAVSKHSTVKKSDEKGSGKNLIDSFFPS